MSLLAPTAPPLPPHTRDIGGCPYSPGQSLCEPSPGPACRCALKWQQDKQGPQEPTGE